MEVPPGALQRDAVSRNREPILAALRARLPAQGSLLELASGSGEHALALAQAFPGWSVQPTDRGAMELRSIEAWRTVGPPNLRAPVALDVGVRPWPLPGPYDLVLAINLIHIVPWAACEALVAAGAARLPLGGWLITYGPYRVGGAHTAPSNLAFDGWLRSQDPTWGVRDQEAVAALAEAQGLTLAEVVPMPANNRVLVFRRTGAA